MSKNPDGQSRRPLGYTSMGHTELVPNHLENVCETSTCSEAIQNNAAVDKQSYTSAPSGPKTSFDGVPCFRENFKKLDLSERSISVLMKSWRGSTCKQYNVYIKKWFQYSSQVQCNSCVPTISNVLDFLASLMTEGCGYSAINTARSALSGFIIVDNLPVGQHPLVKRFLRGVFNIKPCLPRYGTTWDVNIVLEYLSLLENESLSLPDMTSKLTMLLTLVSGQRCQSLACLDIRDMYIEDDCIVFRFNVLLKQTRPFFQVAPLVLRKFSDSPPLCVYSLLKLYLKTTSDIRGDTTKLLLMIRKPHYAVTSQTVARWIKKVMTDAGIDTNIFSAHSTRSAATSAAKSVGMSLTSIMNAVGWSNSGTFHKFYHRTANSDNFGLSVLSKYSTSDNSTQ